jgi:hypothetical protein
VPFINTTTTDAFTFVSLPSLGNFTTLENASIELNDTYTFQTLLFFTSHASTSFSDACVGAQTAFIVKTLNGITHPVKLCIINVLDAPQIDDIALVLEQNTSRIIELFVTDQEDVDVDALGNPSPGRIRTSPFIFVPGMYFQLSTQAPVRLFQAQSPFYCDTQNSEIDRMYPVLINNQERFFLCLVLFENATNNEEPSVIEYSFSGTLLPSNTAQISFSVAASFRSLITSVSMLESDDVLVIEIPTNIANPVFKLLSLPFYGTLSCPIYELFNSVNYTLNRDYYNESDSFTFIVGQEPFDELKTSVVQTMVIYVAPTHIKGELKAPSCMFLLRDESTLVPDLTWVDYNHNMYPIKVTVILAYASAGIFVVDVTDDIVYTPKKIEMVGLPADINALLGRISVLMATDESIINGTQAVVVYVNQPFPSSVFTSTQTIYVYDEQVDAPVVQGESVNAGYVVGMIVVLVIGLLVLCQLVCISLLCCGCGDEDRGVKS